MHTTRSKRCFQGASAVLSALVAVLVLSEPASAVPTQPPINYFYYVYKTDTPTSGQALGCADAHTDASHSRNSEVVLHFGIQNAGGTGTVLPSSTTTWTNAQDEAYATAFSLGYQTCESAGTMLTLGVGTSNDANVTASNGGVWGRVVQAVINWDSSHNYTAVDVEGASDIESWGTYAAFTTWETGSYAYTTYTSAALLDFGSADGCNDTSQHYQNTICTGDWNTSANYNVAWNFQRNIAAPQVYYPGGTCNGKTYKNQSMQWANISMFGVYAGANKINFDGPLWDNNGCFSSSSAEWSTFWNALNTDGVAMTPYHQFQITTN